MGDEFRTAGRTVTETDIVNFAGLSWDNASLHTDEEYAKERMQGGRIAHGLLILSMYSGLRQKLGIVDGTTIGFVGLDLRIPRAVFAGDTIHGTMTVVETKPTSKGEGGIVKSRFEIVNQRGELTMEGHETLLIQCRPETPGE